MKTTMKTTMKLGAIRACYPCADGWKKLIAACGTSADDHVVDLRDILRSNGPRDAWWATRCLPRRERVALGLLAARTVEHLSPEAREYNAVTSRWLAGDATDADLEAAAWAAAETAAWVEASTEAAWAAAWAAASAEAAMEAREAASRAVRAAASWEAAAAAREPAWKNLGEIMLQWCDEQDQRS